MSAPSFLNAQVEALAATILSGKLPDGSTWVGINTNITGGGGSGGPATIADGADVAEGAKADAAVTNPASSASVIALLKGILTELLSTLTVSQAPLATYSPIADATISSAAATQFPSGGPLSGRKGIYVFNNDAAIYMRWGDSTVTATKGGRIAPGTGVTIMGSAALYLFAESGSPTASGTEFK